MPQRSLYIAARKLASNSSAALPYMKGFDSMKLLPYGYRLENGVAIIDDNMADAVKQFFSNYLAGMGLTAAAKKAGFTPYHGSAKRILQNRHYLGDAFYPAILDETTFDQAAAMLIKRAEKLGRLNKAKAPIVPKISNQFYMLEPTVEEINPLLQAEYLYSLIKPEVG